MNIESELRRLIDRRTIEDLTLKYCRGVDRKDADLVRSCFHEDAFEDHGLFRGSILSFINDGLLPSFASYDALLHCVTNQLIEFAGDNAAHGEACVLLWMRHKDQPRADGGVVDFAAGRYISRFERRHDEWKIAGRVLAIDFGESRAMNHQYPPHFHLFKGGLPAPQDLVYHWNFPSADSSQSATSR